MMRFLTVMLSRWLALIAVALWVVFPWLEASAQSKIKLFACFVYWLALKHHLKSK